ncbi:MAG: nucleoside-diphosphate kinase [Candidatus Omnitrophica bacterium]|jgi:nucleoside-diphosphate kinase|nr:nucleoside-diphosphate kinase [Candidatus Omnitrophota bacterium]
MVEATLVLIKPDGLKKSLTGNILTRLSETKLDIVAARMTNVSMDLAKAHYNALSEKPFFPELIKYLQGEFHGKRKVMAMVYYGEGAIEKIRKIAGATNPEEADSVTIRGQYGRITTKGVYENVIHASANQTDAEREIKLWFSPSEIIVDLYPTRQAELVKCERVWA